MDARELFLLVEKKGIYAAARNLLLKPKEANIPINICGVATRSYLSVPCSRFKGHMEVVEAACRLWDEGFYSCVFYPENQRFRPHLLVVWDEMILSRRSVQQPCMTCDLEMHERSRCEGCSMLSAWASSMSIGGTFIRGAIAEESEVVVEQPRQLTEEETISCIPSAAKMLATSAAFQGEDFDNFEESIYTRIMRRLERWATSHQAMYFPFMSRPISSYITVPLTPRESSENAELRRVIIRMEKKGYCCGPMTSMANRTVLFATWDEDLIYYFPSQSPCIGDCEENRGNIQSCYCTEYEAWIAKWNNMTQDIRVREQ